jgi:hypothetical protein
MAIIILGKTVCLLCGEVIQAGDEIEAFPHIIFGELDPLRMFSDGGFHAACFHNHPLSEQMLTRREMYSRNSGKGNRMCWVCKLEIEHPDEFATVGFLTDDEEHPLFSFNYAKFHKHHIAKWEDLSAFISLIEESDNVLKWSQRQIDEFLDYLRTFTSS